MRHDSTAARSEQPEGALLRKKIRGEPLSDEELAILQATYRRPPPGTTTFSQEQVEALLAERKRLGE